MVAAARFGRSSALHSENLYMTVADGVLPESRDARVVRLAAVNLFLVGLLVLFLELASIRWFAASVIFLQFFTNVVLIASFLGMSCGCLAARHRRDWLSCFPSIAFATVLGLLQRCWSIALGAALLWTSEAKGRHKKSSSEPNTAARTSRNSSCRSRQWQRSSSCLSP